MTWSQRAAVLWGKTYPDEHRSMSLVRHLEDAQATAEVLWDSWAPGSVKRAIAEPLRISFDQARRLVAFLCAIHDIGKATPAFAILAQDVGMDDLCSQIRHAGLPVPYTMENHLRVRHWITGHRIVTDWLQQSGCQKRMATRLASVVGSHHGRPPTNRQLVSLSQDSLGGPEWGAVQREILDSFAARTGVVDLLPVMLNRLTPAIEVLLTGLVVMADWIASNADLMPYIDRRSSPERATDAVQELRLGRQWLDDELGLCAEELFAIRFPTMTPRPMQLAVCRAALEMTQPGLLVVEDAMGSGKTEAAYLAAEILCRRFGLNGTFIGLPTMATSNPMFSRTQDWLRSVTQDPTSINLMHSKAFLNEDFQNLRKTSWCAESRGEQLELSGVYVASWFAGRHRGLLANHTVGTVDQALLGALKAKHVELRLFALAAKVVILDEVHAADDVMRTYAARLLEWLGAFRAPVILMSATLPDEQRHELVEAYARGRGVPAALASTTAYPRLTQVADPISTIPVEPSGRSLQVELVRTGDDLDTLGALLEDQLREGGCAAVIRNTVRRAQETYAVLRARFGSDVVLHHSRFLAPHRAIRERELVAELGKPGPDQQRPARRIIVGTQVLEQSLDIDLDLMVTDLAPLDLVLQRIGRLHRHAAWDSQRPTPLRRPRCYLTGAQWSSPPVIDRGSRTVYGAARLLRAAAVLPDQLQLPDQIANLVAEAYRPDLPAPAGWEDAWQAASQQAEQEKARLRKKAGDFLLDGPDDLTCLVGLIDVTDEASVRRQSVRDGEDSLEILVAYLDEDGLTLPDGIGPASRTPVPWVIGPRDQVGRDLARCTIALPRQMATEDVIRALESAHDYTGWANSPWVSGELLLALSPDGTAEVAGFAVTYDTEMGLMVEAVREES